MKIGPKSCVTLEPKPINNLGKKFSEIKNLDGLMLVYGRKGFKVMAWKPKFLLTWSICGIYVSFYEIEVTNLALNNG